MKWFSLFFLILFVACSSKKTVATDSARLHSMDKIEQWDIIIEPVKAPANLFTDTFAATPRVPSHSSPIPDFRPVHIKATKHTTASKSSHEQRVEIKQHQQAQSAGSTFPSKRQLFVVFFIVIVMYFLLRLARSFIGY